MCKRDCQPAPIAGGAFVTAPLIEGGGIFAFACDGLFVIYLYNQDD